MRTYEIEVYTFPELSDRAKERAMSDYGSHEPAWVEENNNSLEEFYELFYDLIRQEGRYLTDHSFRAGGYVEEVLSLSGFRLMKYLWNNYRRSLYKGKWYGKGKAQRRSNVQLDNSGILTGYWADDAVLSPIYEFMSKPDGRTFEDLLTECVESWRIAVEREYEWQQSEEYFNDIAEANRWEFTEYGQMI